MIYWGIILEALFLWGLAYKLAYARKLPDGSFLWWSITSGAILVTLYVIMEAMIL